MTEQNPDATEAPEQDEAPEVADRQIKALLRKDKVKVDDVPEAKFALALERHTRQVRAAGGEVEPDFWTRQFLSAVRTR